MSFVGKFDVFHLNINYLEYTKKHLHIHLLSLSLRAPHVPLSSTSICTSRNDKLLSSHQSHMALKKNAEPVASTLAQFTHTHAHTHCIALKQ